MLALFPKTNSQKHLAVVLKMLRLFQEGVFPKWYLLKMKNENEEKMKNQESRVD